MKMSILIMTAALLITVNASGQAVKNVPANTKTTFSQKFPKASNAKWSKENDKEWEVEFKMDGKDFSANFNNAGAWIETEYAISTNEIPLAVKTTLDKEFAGYKIKVSELSETKDGKTFEFVIEKGESKMELAINGNGKVLNKEQLKEDDEKDEN